MTRPRPDATVVGLVCLGGAAAVAQTVLLREAMSALGGSELAWGVVLGTWLGGMALGAWVGARRACPDTMGPALVLILAGGGVVLLRAAPAILGQQPGEVGSTLRALWVWLAAVAPAGVGGGWAFAVLAGRLLRPGAAGRAYGLESGGAVLGGLAFTFLLAPLGSVAALCLTMGLVGCAQLLVRRWRWAALAALVMGTVLAGPAERALAGAGWRWAGHPGDLSVWRNTRQQRLELSSGSPASLYADGRLQAVLPDPYRSSLRAHLLALLHPAPRRVLLVGAVPGDLDRQLLRHPIERLDEVIEDPGLLDLLEQNRTVPELSVRDGARRRLVTGDPLRVVQEGGSWDLIVLADGDPVTVRQNRTRTVELLRAAADALAPDGVLAMRVGVGDTYLAGAGGRLLAMLHATLRQALPEVRAIPGEEVWLLGGHAASAVALTPEILAGRWRSRSLADDVFAPEMLPLLLDPDRASSLQRFLDAAQAEVNSAPHPRAVLLATALQEGRTEGAVLGWLSRVEGTLGVVGGGFAVTWAVWLLVAGFRRRCPRFGVAGLVGLASMGWWLVLLAAWQASRGSVYAEVGALSAAFMAGLWAGSGWVARRSDPAARLLPWVLAAGGGLSGVLALGVARVWPLITVPLLLVTAGLLTGAAFPGLATLPGPGGRALGAGRGFAADELGAALGAVVLGVLVVPVLGTSVAAAGVGCLLLAAASGVRLAARGTAGT
ncbi:MAG: hypothetical protein MUF10_07755 [Thermoanaerobaculaceae bacterium]|nr:hypothetical protein [Thermoanaerobaculaceae bacterium]